jgi:diguanylate cyclase (GGDEF)-like protein/PAS domain S-box-containing protein
VRLLSFQCLKVAFFLLVLCALFPVGNAFAVVELEQNSTHKYQRISTKDGLSQLFVFDIEQDKDGFIWIATQDGLNRYDGQEFRYYRHNPSDKTSIADNFTRNLFIDHTGQLWIGTANGLSRYIKEYDSFENYTHKENDNNSLTDNVIWNITEDKSNNLIVTTKLGFHRYVREENNFSKKTIRNLDTNLVEIKTVFQDDNSNFWIGGYDSGIYIVNNSLTRAVALSDNNNWNLDITANALYEMKIIGNNYWLATDNGAYVLSKDYTLKNHYLFDNADGSPDNIVRRVELSSTGELWVATDNGLKVINNLSGDWYKQDENNTSFLTDNHIFSLLRDANDSMWVGSLNGIKKYTDVASVVTNSKENSHEISSHVESMTFFDDKLYFTHEGEIFFQEQDKLLKSNISISDVAYLLTNGKDLLALSYNNELTSINVKSGITKSYNDWKNFDFHNLNSKFVSLSGVLWFIDSRKNLTGFRLNKQEFFIPEEFKNSRVMAFNTQKGQLLIATDDNKVHEYDFLTGNHVITSIPLNNKYSIESVSSISKNNGWFILGSQNQGALLFSASQDNTSIHFDENSGLKNSFIADIIADNSGNFWLSTNAGITSITTNEMHVRNYASEYGIKNDEFTSNSSAISSIGRIYFGGNKGFDSFVPNELLNTKQSLAKPIITDLLIANKKIKYLAKEKSTYTGNFVLNKAIHSTSSLELDYKDSPFSFDFIVPNAKISDQLVYEYKLEGLDQEWITTDNNNRRATYTYPSSGSYRFKLRAFDRYAPNNVVETSLNLFVRPPWWLSSTAIFVYSLFVLLILTYILQQMRHKRLYHMQIKQSEERLKLSLWGSGDEMWDWNIKSSKIYRSNIWGILDFPQDGTRNVGGGGETNIHENDNTRIREALQEHIDGNSEHFEVTYRVKDKNGQWIWVLDRGKIVERNDKGQPIRMTGTLKDISQIKRADERLKLFAKCIENISDAVVIYDRKFTIVDVNKAFQRITGKTKQQMIGTPMKFSRYAEKFLQAVKFHLLNKGSWHGEIESRRANGEIYLTDLNIDIIRDESGNISHFVGVFSDITKRKETEQELRRLANSDTLTGLPNRSYFQANQAKLVKNKTPHALLVFDLDNFKKVNDSMGHEVGDALLCRVANRIRNIGRKQDTVYRLGGDEFSIIIEDTNDIHTITTIAKNILKTIAEPLKLKSQEIVLYSSIGIVLYPEDGATPQELLKNADTAMYHAKNSGGNKYQFFSESMNKQAVKRLQIESLIRHGLKEDNFSVFYQPKIEISTGKIAGMEALVRFETPSKGIISPAVFIPVSEETGQIIDIGEVVLRKACFATKKWVDAGLFDGRIAVNLSAVQFTQPNLVGMISDILHESQLPAKYLELEITEGTVMDSPQQAIDTMLQIRSMGIHLSLDDFGTGYSSLAYLKKFPLNTLKIDKAFVDDIETSEQGRNMVATIVTIAHNLGLHVVAEGVETNQQLSFLAGLRCEQLQGYLYSKPLAESAFQSYLLSHQITDKSTSFTKSDS